MNRSNEIPAATHEEYSPTMKQNMFYTLNWLFEQLIIRLMFYRIFAVVDNPLFTLKRNYNLRDISKYNAVELTVIYTLMPLNLMIMAYMTKSSALNPFGIMCLLYILVWDFLYRDAYYCSLSNRIANIFVLTDNGYRIWFIFHLLFDSTVSWTGSIVTMLPLDLYVELLLIIIGIGSIIRTDVISYVKRGFYICKTTDIGRLV